MVHTVFVNDKPLRFTDVYENEQWKGNTESIFISESDMSIEDAIHELEEIDKHPGFIYMSTTPDVSWHLFISYCNLIEASGGLVENDKNEYLIIFRRGKWDLRKGKMEYDETPEAAALREVEEECGITEGFEIVKPLQITFHTYFEKKKRMLKKNHWFLMKYSGGKKLVPQLDEDIVKAEWMNIKKIKQVVLKNTYGAIGELLRLNLKDL